MSAPASSRVRREGSCDCALRALTSAGPELAQIGSRRRPTDVIVTSSWFGRYHSDLVSSTAPSELTTTPPSTAGSGSPSRRSSAARVAASASVRGTDEPSSSHSQSAPVVSALSTADRNPRSAVTSPSGGLVCAFTARSRAPPGSPTTAHIAVRAADIGQAYGRDPHRHLRLLRHAGGLGGWP